MKRVNRLFAAIVFSVAFCFTVLRGMHISPNQAVQPYCEAATQALVKMVRAISLHAQEDFEYVLKRGANPNGILRTDSGSISVLQLAILQHRESVVRLLLAHGADHTLKFFPSGYRPLHYAASSGHRVMTKILLDAGADVTVHNSQGETPLYCAAAHNQPEIVELLLQSSADISVEDGLTSLAIAKTKGHEAVVKILVTYMDERYPLTEGLCALGY